ncbi:DUF6611 family protein [Microbacterium aurantiacum]|uniref:DUF6611 family protein n=1 Tax=Microbacterium aurantiacum TaxID=162393 RepID=UPI0030017D5B
MPRDDTFCVPKSPRLDSPPRRAASGQIAPHRDFRSQRWGHLSQSTGRYGSVTTHLLVHAPGSTSEKRPPADSPYTITPVGISGSVFVAVVVLFSIGLPFELALLALAGVFVIGGGLISSRTIALRRRSASAWAWASAISPRDRQSYLQIRLTDLAETMAEATRARRQGMISEREYLRTWHDVFAVTMRLEKQQGARGRAGGSGQ